MTKARQVRVKDTGNKKIPDEGEAREEWCRAKGRQVIGDADTGDEIRTGKRGQSDTGNKGVKSEERSI